MFPGDHFISIFIDMTVINLLRYNGISRRTSYIWQPLKIFVTVRNTRQVRNYKIGSQKLSINKLNIHISRQRPIEASSIDEKH